MAGVNPPTPTPNDVGVINSNGYINTAAHASPSKPTTGYIQLPAKPVSPASAPPPSNGYIQIQTVKINPVSEEISQPELVPHSAENPFYSKLGIPSEDLGSLETPGVKISPGYIQFPNISAPSQGPVVISPTKLSDPSRTVDNHNTVV